MLQSLRIEGADRFPLPLWERVPAPLGAGGRGGINNDTPLPPWLVPGHPPSKEGKGSVGAFGSQQFTFKKRIYENVHKYHNKS